MAGYINVDLRPDCGDFTADVRSLPWPDGSVDEIQAIDILEHFPVTQTAGILKEWRRVLRNGATITVRVPNLQELGSMISRDDESVRAYIRNVYGGHRWGVDGILDTHHTGWTPRTLAEDFENASLVVISNDRAANMTVSAVAA